MSSSRRDAASERLRAENEDLRRRLEEAEDALRAIREGEVDAVIVTGARGDRVFSLAETENLHRLMVETMNEAGIATSPDGTILYCNQRACALLQRSSSELLGRHLSEIVAPQHLDRISLLLDNASRGTTNDRIMFVAADESPVPMQVWASRAETLEGPMISMVGTDLSLLEADHALLLHLEEQQRALQERERDLADTETDLQRRREEMETLFNESPAAILIAHDVECRSITRNAEATRIFGASSDLDNPARKLLHRAIVTATAHRVDEMAVERDDGNEVIVTGGAAPLFDANGRVRGAVAVFNNITVHVHTQVELHEALMRRDHLVSELEVAQRDLKQSHLDLEEKVKERTMLSEQRGEKLRAMADALTSAEQEERRRLAQRLHDDLQQMLVAIRLRLANLESIMVGTSLLPTVRSISEIVDSAITSSRSLTLELSPPVLREPLSAIIEWLARWFETHHQVFVEVSIAADVRDPSEEAKKFLFQAVRELILNVRKHSGKDAARVHIFSAGDEVGIEVHDDGKGFEPGVLQDNARVAFGLFSIRERVDLMGGSFDIQSTQGHGTTCIIRVPVVASPAKAAPALDGGKDAATPEQAAPVRVLVVDDHTIFRRGLISILESYSDIKVVGEASDGQEGVERAGDLLPDVVIMDLAMPRMNGIEATRAIKSRFMSIDVIALSFQESEHARTSVLQAGATAYFTKSGPLENLLRAIREHGGPPGPGDRHSGNGNGASLPSVRPRESTRATPIRDSGAQSRRSSSRTRRA